MRSTKRSVFFALLIAPALTIAACGGDDDAGDEGDTGGGATTTTAAGGDAGDGDGGDTGGDAGFGEAIDATVTVSGAVEETYTLGDSDIILGGGCQGTRLGVQIQVRSAADALNDRRLVFDLEAAGLEGSGGMLDFSTSATWVMGCP